MTGDKKEAFVTFHALRRYAQRVYKVAIPRTLDDYESLAYLKTTYNVDLEKLRHQMLTPSIRAAIAAGASSVKSSDGCQYIIDRSTIITVIDDHKIGARAHVRRRNPHTRAS